MKILFCTPRPPYPLIYGDSLIVYHVASQLSKEHDVFLLSLTKGDKDDENVRVLKKRKIFDDIITINFPKPSVVGKWLDRLLSDPKRHISLRYPRFKERFVSVVHKIVKDKAIDVIHSHGLLTSLLLAEYTARPKVAALIDSMGLHLQRAMGTARGIMLWKAKYLYYRAVKLERFILKAYSSVIVVSSQDAMFLKNLHEKASIEVIPNGVDTDYFHPISDVHRDEQRKKILFFGNMAYEPNQDAAFYIAKEILPLVRREVQDAILYIVGANPPDVVRKLDDGRTIVVTGFVEDIRKYIAQADVVLVPMRKGSGIKNKILEAMAMGKVVVTTSCGAEGLSSEARRCLVVADDPVKMAVEVVELLQNCARREELGERARHIVCSQYSWALCAHRYWQTYEKAITGTG